MSDLSGYLKYGDGLIEQMGATENLAPTLKRVLTTYVGGVSRKLKDFTVKSKHLTSEFDTFIATHSGQLERFQESPLPIGDGIMTIPKGMSGSYRETIEGIIDGFTLLNLPETFAMVVTILDHLERDLKSDVPSSSLIIKYSTELENLKKISDVSGEVVAAQRKLFGNAHSHPRPMKSVISTRHEFTTCLNELKTLTHTDHLGTLKAQVNAIESVAENIVKELERREHYRKTVATLIQKIYSAILNVTDAYAVLLHNTMLLTHAFVVGTTTTLRIEVA